VIITRLLGDVVLPPRPVEDEVRFFHGLVRGLAASALLYALIGWGVWRAIG
jgi:hypothetical protein